MNSKLLKGLFILLCSMGSCNSDSSSLGTSQEIFDFITNEENGFIRVKSIGNFEVELTALPLEYKFAKDNDGLSLKEFRKKYQNSLNFIMKIKPNENRKYKGDVSLDQIQNWQQYEQRLKSLNFDLKNHMELVATNGETVNPVLVNFENYYGSNRDCVFSIAFAVEDISTFEPYTFVYHDDQYSLGSVRFKFTKSDFREAKFRL